MRRLTCALHGGSTRPYMASLATVSVGQWHFSTTPVVHQLSSANRGSGGFGRPRSPPTNSNSRDSSPAPPQRPIRLNTAGDSEISSVTAAAMRDDSIILSDIFRCMPHDGAISVKSLSANLSSDVQEALSERHGGLAKFLEQRQQFFVMKPRPTDQVLFVAGNAVAMQKFKMRALQQRTMRDMMGLNDDPRSSRGGPRERPPMRRSESGSQRRGNDSGRHPSGQRPSWKSGSQSSMGSGHRNFGGNGTA